MVRALILVKKAAAQANVELGMLDRQLGALIEEAADEVLAGLHPGAFPLRVWQTGSGTQSNMNVNEVLAHVANSLATRHSRLSCKRIISSPKPVRRARSRRSWSPADAARRRPTR